MQTWVVGDSLKWRPLGSFGVEIEHDLSVPLPPATAERFVALLWEWGLVVAHGQKLSMQQQSSLMALLGPILRRSGETGYLTTASGSEASLSELSFHADAAYTKAPFDALSLHAIDVVNGASSTRFASAQRAYDLLPPQLRERLAEHAAEMISPNFETIGKRSCEIREHAPMRHALLPSIFVNPHTARRCVWVSEMHAARLAGMDWEESRTLLNAVFDHLYAQENVYEHSWHQGDLVIWDNIALQHSRGTLKNAGRRILQRVIVGTEGVCPQIPLNA